MIWARADGCRVWDEHGREYIDLTGGFGVAVLGHGNARIREAVANAPVVHVRSTASVACGSSYPLLGARLPDAGGS